MKKLIILSLVISFIFTTLVIANAGMTISGITLSDVKVISDRDAYIREKFFSALPDNGASCVLLLNFGAYPSNETNLCGNSQTISYENIDSVESTGIGRNILFDGLDGYVSISDHDDFSFGDGTSMTSDMTWAAWIYPSDDIPEYYFSKRGITNSDKEFAIYKTANGGPLRFKSLDCDGNCLVNNCGTTMGTCESLRWSDAAMPADQWVYLVVTYDSSTYPGAGTTFYINGEVFASSDGTEYFQASKTSDACDDSDDTILFAIAHNLVAGQPIVSNTTACGTTSGTTYYVCSAGLTSTAITIDNNENCLSPVTITADAGDDVSWSAKGFGATNNYTHALELGRTDAEDQSLYAAGRMSLPLILRSHLTANEVLTLYNSVIGVH